jgi:hypothetical protein
MVTVESLVEDFTRRLAAIIEHDTIVRARAAVEGALGGQGRGPGRPPKALSLLAGARRRRKAPRQLCPVPGCKKPAAPVFGMVCADHKNVAKAKIRKYREARRAKKAKAG